MYDRAKSSVFSLLRKTCSDGDACTDSGRLFQTDSAAAGKVRSPMVARTVHGATSADVVEERSHRRALDACSRQPPSAEATARAQCASPTDLKVDRTSLKLWETSGGEGNGCHSAYPMKE